LFVELVGSEATTQKHDPQSVFAHAASACDSGDVAIQPGSDAETPGLASSRYGQSTA